MLRLTRYLLFGIALTPLITLNLPFGTIVWKLFYMRIVIELAVIFFCIHMLRGGKVELPWRHPILLFLGAYTLSLVISTIGADSPYRAVWGNLERGEGLVTWLHYIAFFLLTLFVWKKDDWFKMFRLSLIVGFVLMGYGALQYFGITYFPPFRIMPSDRAISLVGNPAFFATHLIFLIILASLVRLHARKTGSRIWEYIALGAIVFAIAVVFMTGTRGAILGLGVGGVVALVYVFATNIRSEKGDPSSSHQDGTPQGAPFSSFPRNGGVRENGQKRKAVGAGIALSTLLLGGMLFFFTKEAPAWKIIPSIERVSSLLSNGIKGTSAETRLITWKMSYEAWKERPLLGWGPENYLPALIKYFNPRLDKGGETWFDRSHNNLIDIAVTQGIVGLIAYGGWMGAIAYRALRKRKEGLLKEAKPYLVWGLAAYIIQNLFLFDQPLSYLYLMIFAGFLVNSESFLRKQESTLSVDPGVKPKDDNRIKHIQQGLAFGASALAAYAIYAWNVTPLLQIRYVEAAKKTPHQEEVLRLLGKGFYPYNFAQHDLRAQIVDHEYSFQPEIFVSPGFTELSSFLLKSVQEARAKDSADPRMLIREIQILTLQSQLKPELLPEVEERAREGVKLAPRKPVFYHKLALALANEEKYEEAKEAAEQAIDLYPNGPKSYFQLGLVLAMGGDPYHEEAVRGLQKYEEMDPKLGVLSQEINNYLLIYAIWKDKAKVADIVSRATLHGIGREIQLPYFRTALAYYMEKEQKEEFLTIARFMVPLFPDIADDLKVYIDLAEKGKWEVIKNI
ncbi:MAG: O-antigen ligase family protein [Nanoarchaeota archaeon]|nr:O-antigen ligase family protein [Nanoarchaeota archaeon]